MSSDTVTFIENLEFSWAAVVRLNNGQVLSIWYTAWYSMKHTIDDVLSVASDYPKYNFKATKRCQEHFCRLYK